MKIKSENLEKSFPPVQALKSLNLEATFESLVVVGPNGSGKTTLLSIIAGLKHPTKGRLWINGIEPYRTRNKAIEEVSFVFEKTPHPYSMRVKEFVNFIGNMRGNLAGARELSEEIGVSRFCDNRMSALSSGQSQLCVIFAGLCCWDGLLILDEPFTHLDAFKTGKLIDILFRRRNVILATHIPEEAEALGDYVLVLHEGKLMWKGTREELYADNVYEIYVKEMRVLQDLDTLYTFGRIALVRSDSNLLKNLVDSGLIIGFRKSGLRRIYSEILQR